MKTYKITVITQNYSKFIKYIIRNKNLIIPGPLILLEDIFVWDHVWGVKWY